MEGENLAAPKRHMVAYPHESEEVRPQWIRDWIFGEYPCDFEPLSAFGRAAGLQVPWHGLSFVFPPLNDTQAWVEKAVREQAYGRYSILLVPAVFNSVYWRETVYQKVSDIRILTCPIRLDGAKKGVTTQMSILVFAAPPSADEERLQPPMSLVTPDGWADNYYKRRRNQARFGPTNE